MSVEIVQKHLRALGIENTEVDVRAGVGAIGMGGELRCDPALGRQGHLLAVHAKRHVAASEFVDQLAPGPENNARIGAGAARQIDQVQIEKGTRCAISLDDSRVALVIVIRKTLHGPRCP